MRTAASTSAVRIAWRGSVHTLACALACVAVAGCTASAEDVRPPSDRLFFPTGMAASPDERLLFVANANSELRYDSGSIAVINMDVVQSAIKDRTSVPGCESDPDHVETLICEDQTQFFKKDSGARIGNFATDLAIQDFTGTGGLLRVFVPTRGDPSISWADFKNDRLTCNEGSDSFALCDDAHRLTLVQNNPDLAIPTEPFGVFADATNGFAMVTHLSGGAVTLIRAPQDSSKVEIVDLLGNVFALSLASGTRAASAIAGRTPGSAGDVVYVGSSSENRVQTFMVGERDGLASFLLPGSYFFLDSVGASSGDSSDTRNMRFSAGGDRLYVANRSPPSLQVFDTSLSPSGVPLNMALGSSDICRQASTLSILDIGGGEGDRAYVTCFQDGQVYVVDPRGQTQVEDIITVGRGPYAAVGITGKNTPDHRPQLVVSNFLEDTIAVIDLSLSSPTRNRVVLRIGKPRTP